MDNPSHLLLVAVIQDQDLDSATESLQHVGASMTYLSSSGGFLGRRNITLLIGIPVDREEDALIALHDACRQRIEYLAMPLEGSPMPMPSPVPVTVGGATIFVLPVERFEEF